MRWDWDGVVISRIISTVHSLIKILQRLHLNCALVIDDTRNFLRKKSHRATGSCVSGFIFSRDSVRCACWFVFPSRSTLRIGTQSELPRFSLSHSFICYLGPRNWTDGRLGEYSFQLLVRDIYRLWYGSMLCKAKLRHMKLRCTWKYIFLHSMIAARPNSIPPSKLSVPINCVHTFHVLFAD